MNLSYLKYAVEVEKTGSITKAAQNFYMNQPHLSKIIRELERDLGCPIFDRTSRGMVPTKRGEEFLRYAKAILVQEEQIESLCVKNSERTLEISLSVPRATYISYAFTDYLKDMRSFPSVSLGYKETNSRDTIRGVSSKSFDLGIIRCQALYESYYMKMLQDETWTGRSCGSFPAMYSCPPATRWLTGNILPIWTLPTAWRWSRVIYKIPPLPLKHKMPLPQAEIHVKPFPSMTEAASLKYCGRFRALTCGPPLFPTAVWRPRA